tara:strand:+ start:950 stop:1354 length:405 start_codon:yes stop_codon:yes gene_type:complete
MERAAIILNNKTNRERAAAWCRNAPDGTLCELKRAKRTLPQNDRLHAMITPIAQTLAWHGQMLSVDDWKLVFLDALNREVRIVPSIDGRGFVNLGRSTSKLRKQECSDLMELISAFAAEHGVDLQDPNPQPAAA